ncbi:MAG: hypothetical protein V3U87_13885 [Methylococcaceae bacterium]
MKTTVQSRLTAAGIHFLASVFLFSILLLIIINIWYPQPYFSASGGWQGLKIVALVDLVLGPLITLAIFNSNKPKKVLAQDLGIIIIIQLAALFYGIHTIYSQRPVGIVFWEGKFSTISAQAMDNQGVDPSTFQQFSNQSPPIIYAEKPTSVKGLTDLLKVIKDQKIPPTQQLNLYRSINNFLPQVLEHSIDINEIISHNSDMAEQLQSLLKQTKTKKPDNSYLVLESKYQNIILVFSANAEIIGYLKAPYKKIKLI